MSLSMFLTGLNGALGLYSTMKGIYDSTTGAARQDKLRKKAFAEEDGWYRRNYYGNYLDNSAARAAIKRVENSLRRSNEQNRAYSAVNGTTPEHALARNEQGLRAMENVMSNIASSEDERKMRVDAMHRQNRQALLADELNESRSNALRGQNLIGSGYNLLQNALRGVEWGRERHDEEYKDDSKGW